MQFLNLTLASPEENLALDEALLDEVESAARRHEVLRFWEPAEPLVIVGRSSRLADEVNLPACRAKNIPVLRRASGGAAVVAGPGCLMYAVVLGYELHPELRAIDRAHRFVLGRMAKALAPLVPGVACRGTSDLVVGDRKFSGNSMRSKRENLLYHGTLLYDFPLELLDACLAMPPRQPEYRAGRRHDAFVMNLPVGAAAIRRAVCHAWEAAEEYSDWPRALTDRLVAEKYARDGWNATGR
ncbi:MAG: lipoate--protein ligase family protein [Pirellulales bacterium]